MTLSFRNTLNTIKYEFESGNVETAELLCRRELNNTPVSGRYILLLDLYGSILKEKADYGRLVDVWEKQLECLEKLFGKNHVHSASVLHNLSLLYSFRKDYAAALKYCGQAVAVLRKNISDGKPELVLKLADFLVSLSMYHYELSQYGEAEALIREALSVYLSEQGEDSFGASTCYNNLGRIYENLNETKKAVQYHAQAADIRKRTLGVHSGTAFCLGNYATALASDGNFDEAVRNFDEALSIYAELGLENSKNAKAFSANKDVCLQAKEHKG